MTVLKQQKRGEKESGKKEVQAANRGHSLLQPQNPLPLTSSASATDTENQGLAYTATADTAAWQTRCRTLLSPKTESCKEQQQIYLKLVV